MVEKTDFPGNSTTVSGGTDVAASRRGRIRGGGTRTSLWGRSDEYERLYIRYIARPREYGLRFTAQWGD